MDGGEHTTDAALLIDWENLKFSLQQRDLRPNVSAIRDTAERFGRVVVARAYADWQDGWHRADPTNLYAAGIEPVYVPTRAYYDDSADREKRKNSVDVKLTADCIELCHNYGNIGVYVLASGDQDFLHVVNTLRPYGKQVVIVGVSWTTSARLAERVDNVVFYDREVDPVAVPEVEAEQFGDAVSQTRQRQIDTAVAEIRRVAGIADDLAPEIPAIVETIIAVVSDYRGRGQELALTGLGMELSKRINAQTFSMVVKGRSKQFTEAMQNHDLIRVANRGMADWLYLPEEALPESDEQEDTRAQGDIALSDHFVDLPAEERREIIAAIRAARAQPGVSYLTFNRICDSLTATTAGRRFGGYTRRLVEGMVESMVLLRDEEKEWFDAPTGRRGTYVTLKLNGDHERVRDCELS